LLINELFTAIIQLAALSFIPIVWWLITARAKTPFFEWIGLKKPVILNKKSFLVWMIAALLVAASMSLVLDPVLPDNIQLANVRFSGKGMNSFLPAVIFSFIATGLSEEIFFRGFLCQRLCGKLGFSAGNTSQAILFGLLHGATLLPEFGLPLPLLIILFTGTLGWLMGYINKTAGDSIMPSWFVHGISNLYATTIIMFELL